MNTLDFFVKVGRRLYKIEWITFQRDAEQRFRRMIPPAGAAS